MLNPIRAIPGDALDDARAARFMETLGNIQHSDLHSVANALGGSAPDLRPRHPPLTNLPCANGQPELHTFCDRPGNMACSACRLVSYCSKQCQKAHWKVHKQDCKNPMRTSDWEPCWLREGRSPTFMNDSTTLETLSRSDPNYGKSMAVGLALWGNTPAVDALNLPRNENDPHKDYSVAFPASGDLRHVVRTINKLPDDFSGNINILLNDGCLNVALRNFVLLLILGTTEDVGLGVDIATHFWYSTFIPVEYSLHITFAIARYASRLASEGKGEEGFKLGLRSAVDAAAIFSAPGAVELLRHFSSADFNVEDAQKECDRVKHNPGRRDFRDRYYLKLKPSQRVAYQEFRRFGLLLPFGAPNHHFNHPNSSLFSKEGKWVQSDFAEPLNGWEVDEVLATGKQHGATPEDIYGCLYFYVSEQLRLFTERLSKFCIRFTLLPMEACMLGNSLQMKSGEQGESSSKGRMTNFDRIIFSNIVDENYVGIRKALTSWAPLLSKSKWATIVAYFMNWPFIQRNGRVRDAGEAVLDRVSGEYVKKKKSLKLQLDSSASFNQVQSEMLQALSVMDAFYDNSKPFSEYLRKVGLNDALEKTGLSLRSKHTIVPHRFRISLDDHEDQLPTFDSEDDWYNYTKLAGYTWCERFVEFGWPN